MRTHPLTKAPPRDTLESTRRCGGTVDTGDLKSPGSNPVPVRVRPPAPEGPDPRQGAGPFWYRWSQSRNGLPQAGSGDGGEAAQSPKGIRVRPPAPLRCKHFTVKSCVKSWKKQAFMRVSRKHPLLHTFSQLNSLQYEKNSPYLASFFHAWTTLKMNDFVSYLLLIATEKVRILFFRLLQPIL